MAFLDEDELQPAGSGSGPRRPGSERQRQLMLRRVIALGVGVVLIILLLLAVKGCLNARKERGFENYATDLKSIVEQTNQLSSEFFKRLEDPPANTDPLNLEAQIASDRGTAEALLQRVEGLDAPDELADAQAELVQSYELRRDALAGIADDIPTALGEEGRADAINRIAEDMREFLASDVLFARARDEINEVLADQGISEEIPESVFLPEPVERWLDHLQLTTVLSTFAGVRRSGRRGPRAGAPEHVDRQHPADRRRRQHDLDRQGHARDQGRGPEPGRPGGEARSRSATRSAAARCRSRARARSRASTPPGSTMRRYRSTTCPRPTSR